MISRFLVAGGDRRMALLANQLVQRGFCVDTLCLCNGQNDSVEINKAQALLLPYPFSVEDGKIRTVSGDGVPLQTILEQLTPGTIIYHHGHTRGAGEERFRWRLYDSDPELVLQNAVISAEGAVNALMQSTEDAVVNLHCLVTGYGIFARALTRMLLGIGAKVTVTARREEALRLAQLDGARTLSLSEIEESNKNWDVVMNTVPAKILNPDVVSAFKPGCILMELASKPGGFDVKPAEHDGKKFIALPGIPGKYAPLAAAKALCDSVIRTLEE
ncbi:MAG: hypothetical protein E7331_04870 [Clostridiales bacterium]|nr:hypothetical protein [Clostridiales bacterium]